MQVLKVCIREEGIVNKKSTVSTSSNNLAINLGTNACWGIGTSSIEMHDMQKGL